MANKPHDKTDAPSTDAEKLGAEKVGTDSDRNGTSRDSHEPSEPFDQTKLMEDSASVRAQSEKTRISGQSNEAEREIASQAAQSPAPSMPVTLGRYLVRERLGRGGFGTVFRAHDTLLDREVAVKVPRYVSSDTEIEEFLTEARRLAQLQHPSIVTIHDVGSQDRICYLVTDLLRGESLADRLKRERLPWMDAVRLVATIADALAHAHTRSMIHRDVKPGNIFLTADGAPILLDFGLALSDLEEEQIGLQAGTPSYMAPEQVRGRAHRVDGRTDIYSLGTVLYELLCGRVPFRASNVNELFRRIREDEPQPPRQLAPQIPPELEQVCLRALAKKQSARFTTAGDFAAALRQVIENETSTTSAPRPLEPPVEPPVEDSSSSQPSSSIRRRMAAHKRHVTVAVFGFELASRGDSQVPDTEYQHELREALEACCTHCVEALGGIVLPAAGLEIVTCFGFPTSYENAAERAIRAALKVLDEVRDRTELLGERLAPDENIAVWAAVHSGSAVVEGGTGEADVSLVGEARTVASRIEALTDPGTITISDETERLVRGVFETEALGERRLRGVSQPITLYSVHGTTGSHRRLDQAANGELTPLVGRDTELAVLQDRWEYAVDGQGQVVLLIGDAGLGKSRLVRELRQHVDSHQVGQRIEWNCSPYRTSSSLHPAIECLQRLLEFSPDVTDAQRLERVERHLEQLGLGSAERVGLMATLLSIPAADLYTPPELSPQRLRELTQELLLDWLQELSATDPVLFVVEDLHWIDASSLELLQTMIDSVASERILMLLTFRPEFQPPWSSRAYQTQVALNRLTRPQVRAMIKALDIALDCNDQFVERLAERTDGVPLFVEEYAKMVQESDTNLEEIPVTLQDLLLARLDRMQSDLRVIQLAATLGREFPYDLLHAVADLDEGLLQEELGKLVAAEILFQKGRLPKCRFLFKHALLQDAAYHSLLRKPRQEFHHRIAHVLETRFRDAVAAEPEVVAQHFTEAGDTQKAIDYWLMAGQRAQGRFANREAMSHFQTGLTLLASVPESTERDCTELDFQLGLATVMTMANGWGFPDVESVHLRARELCERIQKDAPLYHVIWGMWAWRLLRDELDLADELSQDLWKLAEAHQDPGYVMESCFAQVCTGLFRGEFARCMEYGQRGMELYDEDRCRFHASRTGQNSGCTIPAHWCWGTWIAGYPDTALKIGERGVALGAELNDPFSHAFAIYHLGCVHQHCRMGAAARASGDASIEIGHEQGFGIWIALGLLCKGTGLLLEGDQLQGIEMVQQGFDAFRASGAELSLSHYYSVLAEAHEGAGRIEDALQCVADGLALAERTSERFHVADLYRLRGDLLLARDPENCAQAEDWFQQAIDVARSQGAKSWELRASTSLAQLWQRQGRTADARAHLSPIYGWFREGFDTHDLIQAKRLLDELA